MVSAGINRNVTPMTAFMSTAVPGPDIFSTACEYIGQVTNMDWFKEEIEARAIVYCQTRADVVEAANFCRGTRGLWPLIGWAKLSLLYLACLPRMRLRLPHGFRCKILPKGMSRPSISNGTCTYREASDEPEATSSQRLFSILIT